MYMYIVKDIDIGINIDGYGDLELLWAARYHTNFSL